MNSVYFQKLTIQEDTTLWLSNTLSLLASYLPAEFKYLFISLLGFFSDWFKKQKILARAYIIYIIIIYIL